MDKITFCQYFGKNQNVSIRNKLTTRKQQKLFVAFHLLYVTLQLKQAIRNTNEKFNLFTYGI